MCCDNSLGNNLSTTDAFGAVYCPSEAIVEPWLVPIGYAEAAIQHGAHIRLRAAVENAYFNTKTRKWRVTAVTAPVNPSVARSAPSEILTPQTLDAERNTKEQPNASWTVDCIVNAAGLYGDTIEQLRSVEPQSKSSFSITPYVSCTRFFLLCVMKDSFSRTSGAKDSF